MIQTLSRNHGSIFMDGMKSNRKLSSFIVANTHKYVNLKSPRKNNMTDHQINESANNNSYNCSLILIIAHV